MSCFTDAALARHTGRKRQYADQGRPKIKARAIAHSSNQPVPLPDTQNELLEVKVETEEEAPSRDVQSPPSDQQECPDHGTEFVVVDDSEGEENAIVRKPLLQKGRPFTPAQQQTCGALPWPTV